MENERNYQLTFGVPNADAYASLTAVAVVNCRVLLHTHSRCFPQLLLPLPLGSWKTNRISELVTFTAVALGAPLQPPHASVSDPFKTALSDPSQKPIVYFLPFATFHRLHQRCQNGISDRSLRVYCGTHLPVFGLIQSMDPQNSP